ncbi:GPI mannosyltransferase 3 [Trypanosoma theileri]|uniref:Mannosyltransferase n=1 Tax=Trypanosoma theileri TaxID=67003 RepID=A0A1X0P926_9TRYP|nr:GPI mannosyltransferase 3 [Trypanosoma theileri]ORC93089.1 GPI mannosyltransferase 3 [Trypanosoma theileri]
MEMRPTKQTELSRECARIEASGWLTSSTLKKPKLAWYAIVVVFFYRLFLCVYVVTAESPDEWWQSSEVAYRMVFGKGHLTWEWHYGLRSVVFPGFLAIPYFLLKQLGLDTAWMIWFVSRFQQALILTGIDLCVFNLGAILDVVLMRSILEKEEEKEKNEPAPFILLTLKDVMETRRMYGSVSSFALYLSLCNWYMIFAGVRVYSNVLEALLFLLTLQQQNYVRFLLLAGLASAFRVTASVVILPLFFMHVVWALRGRGIIKGLGYILFWGLFLLIVILGSLVISDSLFYKELTITPLNFIRFNVIQNASQLFGKQPWYYYFFPCLPLLLGPHIIFLLSVPWVILRQRECKIALWGLIGLLCAVIWTMCCYSLIDHKENRFIFPVLPLCFIIIAVVLSQWYYKYRVVRLLHRSFMLLNLLMAFFVCCIYRRGPLDVMEEVRKGPLLHRMDIISTCYTTPGYSYMHGKVRHLGIIDCPVHLDEQTGLPALTEDIMFRRYPKEYILWKYDGIQSFNRSNKDENKKADELQQTVKPKSALYPDVMVMFRYTAQMIKEPFLLRHGYRLYRSFFHAPFSLEPYEDSYIEMWVRREA